jgi:hypothetical protein
MQRNATQFIFDAEVSMQEVEATLLLSRLATESLHGFDRVELEASAHVDHGQRSVAIEQNSDVAHTLALIFLGYCRREFGESAIRVISERKMSVKAGMEAA